MRILVTEELAPGGLAAMQDAGHEVDVRLGLSPDELLDAVGLGRVGALVAQRAYAFGMRLLAYDPYIAPERARQMGVELLDLEDLVRQADFLTIHLPKTPETTSLIGEELLRHAKPELRIVNTARGGIVDEAALAAAVRDGHIAGAALDVFDEEPTTSSP